MRSSYEELSDDELVSIRAAWASLNGFRDKAGTSKLKEFMSRLRIEADA